MQNNQEHLVWSLGHKPLQQEEHTHTRTHVQVVPSTLKQQRAAFYVQKQWQCGAEAVTEAIHWGSTATLPATEVR